jgi:hypothetical protein
MNNINVIFIIIALILEIIAVSTDYWGYIYSDEIKGYFNYGILELCGKIDSKVKCIDVNEGDIEISIKLIRFFVFVSLIGLIISIRYPIVLLLTILCNITVTIIFFTKINNNFKYETGSNSIKIGYSIILFILSTIIGMVNLVILRV